MFLTLLLLADLGLVSSLSDFLPTKAAVACFPPKGSEHKHPQVSEDGLLRLAGCFSPFTSRDSPAVSSSISGGGVIDRKLAL